MWLQSLYEDMNSTQGVHVTCKAILRAEQLDGRVHALYGAKTGKNSNFSGCHFLWHTGRVRLDSQPLNISRHVVISIVKSFFFQPCSCFQSGTDQDAPVFEHSPASPRCDQSDRRLVRAVVWLVRALERQELSSARDRRAVSSLTWPRGWPINSRAWRWNTVIRHQQLAAKVG